jgi:hypothetical protein
MEYSLNRGVSWEEATSGTAINTNGNDIAFRGTTIATCHDWGITGTNVRVRGNINSLLTYDPPLTTLPTNAFRNLFLNCSSIVYGDITLPSVSLSQGCYLDMFRGCTNLQSTPELPAETLALSCYDGMFRGCTSLTTAPVIQATTLAPFCCEFMFYGCTRLTEIPILPATTLANNCYNQMFEGCTGLISLKNDLLPATVLADYCYSRMFYGCTKLTNAPELKYGTTERSYSLVTGCYASMFTGCRKLSYAPRSELYTKLNPSQALMFSGCTELDYPLPLDYIPSSFGGRGKYDRCIKITGATSITPKWDPNGKPPLQYSLDDGTTWVDATVAQAIPTGNQDVLMRGDLRSSLQNAGPYDPWVFVGTEVKIYGDICNIAYSSWPDRDPSNPLMAFTAFCFLNLFKGCTNLNRAPAIGSNAANQHALEGMFSGCTTLQKVPELYIDRINLASCRDMFQGCIAIKEPPQLPANDFSYGAVPFTAVYQRMFEGCIHLETAPELPTKIMTADCYSGMFKDCHNLQIAPKLPSVLLSARCYFEMFSGCWSLNTPPELPADTVYSRCYMNMFYECVNLETAPALPGTQIAPEAYSGMFAECNYLITAPGNDIYTTKTPAMANMFYACFRLQHIIPFDDIPKAWGGGYDYFTIEGATSITPRFSGAPIYYRIGNEEWRAAVSGVAFQVSNLAAVQFRSPTNRDNLFSSVSTANAWTIAGNNVKLSGDIFSLLGYEDYERANVGDTGFNNMFRGCTNIVSSPWIIGADVVGNHSFQGMFYGCSNLTVAPILTATELGTNTYQDMFYGCIKLTDAPEADRYTTYTPVQSHMFGECTALVRPLPYGNLPAGWD